MEEGLDTVDPTPSPRVGYRKPPGAHQFTKGRSGNPKGRPRGRFNQPPYEAVLGQKVTIRTDGREHRVTAAEAFLRHITKKGLEGDGPAARAAMAAIEQARARRVIDDGPQVDTIILVAMISPGSVSMALTPLRMARKLDRLRPSVKVKLEPWLVEAALARFGGRRLTVDEQRVVVEATRVPHKVRWPDWWVVRS